jgi:DNA-directed RNA polymerase specialized sigma24 family protein
LHHHPFYGNWQPTPVTEKIKELQKCYPDEITGVENSESYLVNGISLWYESDSKVASEQALFYSMLRCDSRRFWPALRNYVKLHLDEDYDDMKSEAVMAGLKYASRFDEESGTSAFAYFTQVLKNAIILFINNRKEEYHDGNIIPEYKLFDTRSVDQFEEGEYE